MQTAREEEEEEEDGTDIGGVVGWNVCNLLVLPPYVAASSRTPPLHLLTCTPHRRCPPFSLSAGCTRFVFVLKCKLIWKIFELEIINSIKLFH